MLMGTLALGACGNAGTSKPAASPSKPLSLEDAVAGDWRLPGDRGRDAWRLPVESLTFWKLQPGQTVVEATSGNTGIATLNSPVGET